MLTAFTAGAQVAIPMLGGDVATDKGSLSYTVGQVAVESDQTPALNNETRTSTLNEGVQQTYRVDEVLIPGVDPVKNLRVFPNPTTDMVTVRCEQEVSGLEYMLYSVNGQLLQKGSFDGLEQQLHLGDYPAGTYMLNVKKGTRESSYRIIKR